jgi:hypothetical protein
VCRVGAGRLAAKRATSLKRKSPLTHKLVFLTVFARALTDWLMRTGARPYEGRDEDPELGVVVGIRGSGMCEMR